MDVCSDDEIESSSGGRERGEERQQKTSRKIAKPIMEKRRRARINASLNELKSLLVEVLQKEGCRHSSKMEKADILEMTVKHLRQLQRQHAPAPSQRDVGSLDKYAMGYNECLNKVCNYLHSMSAATSADASTAVRLANHLASRLCKTEQLEPHLQAPHPYDLAAGQGTRSADSAAEVADVTSQRGAFRVCSPSRAAGPSPLLPAASPTEDYRGGFQRSFALGRLHSMTSAWVPDTAPASCEARASQRMPGIASKYALPPAPARSPLADRGINAAMEEERGLPARNLPWRPW